MGLLTTHSDLDSLGGGRFRHTQHMRPIAYADAGMLKPIVSDFVAGDATFPHAIDTAPFFARVTAHGDWRVHPTRDEKVWFSIGAPFLNPASPIRASLNSFARKDNVLISVNADFDVRVIHGGHFLKLEIPLKGGYLPTQGMVAFPIGSQGVDLKDGILLVDGKPVMQFRPPVVYDAANPEDVRPVATTFQSIGAQRYIILTLPGLAGMIAPVVDPTLTLQPDATAGKDTYISSYSGATNEQLMNMGVSNRIAVGEHKSLVGIFRSLIQFDLSSLEASAIISSTLLGLTTFEAGGTRAAVSLIFDVYNALRAWVEGTRDYVTDSPATGATWIRYDTTSNWATEGCGNTTTDRSSVSIGTSPAYLITDPAGTTRQTPITGTTKTAINNVNGWVLVAQTENADLVVFGSSDHATAAYRPQLVVIYSLPGRAPFCAPFQGAFG